MAYVLWMNDSLDCHHGAVDHARPDRKPDQAAVRERVARCEQEKHAERGVDRENHLKILGPARMPRPTRRPNYCERVEPKQGNDAHENQREAQVLDAIYVRHDLLPVERFAGSIGSLQLREIGTGAIGVRPNDQGNRRAGWTLAK